MSLYKKKERADAIAAISKSVRPLKLMGNQKRTSIVLFLRQICFCPETLLYEGSMKIFVCYLAVINRPFPLFRNYSGVI